MCPTLCDSMDYIQRQEFFQARILRQLSPGIFQPKNSNPGALYNLQADSYELTHMELVFSSILLI